jgi:hypothetical protein
MAGNTEVMVLDTQTLLDAGGDVEAPARSSVAAPLWPTRAFAQWHAAHRLVERSTHHHHPGGGNHPARTARLAGRDRRQR